MAPIVVRVRPFGFVPSHVTVPFRGAVIFVVEADAVGHCVEERHGLFRSPLMGAGDQFMWAPSPAKLRRMLQAGALKSAEAHKQASSSSSSSSSSLAAVSRGTGEHKEKEEEDYEQGGVTTVRVEFSCSAFPFMVGRADVVVVEPPPEPPMTRMLPMTSAAGGGHEGDSWDDDFEDLEAGFYKPLAGCSDEEEREKQAAKSSKKKKKKRKSETSLKRQQDGEGEQSATKRLKANSGHAVHIK
eukprot:TRINITY_DN66588_c7_g2_i1.p2 TRINITY_DN66588_c7_g2~~TRINITY_DN66588_c7_g2_i1.p2  ORF type:complete len:242 (-),score=125.77 TRINITY_DN66588_c7_g2_i1:28-753(-)